MPAAIPILNARLDNCAATVPAPRTSAAIATTARKASAVLVEPAARAPAGAISIAWQENAVMR